MAEKYERLRVIGRGTFGLAWLSRSRSSRRPYVVKEVRLAGMTEKDRHQAVNEVAILAGLKHANVVRYREAFIDEATLYIAMEYADGGDLSEKIAVGRQAGEYFTEGALLDWFVQISFALRYIHARKILHRDLKPQNIFLTSQGMIKIGDFGIARMLQNSLDHAHTAIGTPYYMSPEICRRAPYNQKSDLWAAGCVLYEMASLVHPFEAPDFSSLVVRILRGRYTPIPRHFGPLVEDLVAVLLRVEPARRPTADQLLCIPGLQPHVLAYTDRCQELRGPGTAGQEPDERRRHSVATVLRGLPEGAPKASSHRSAGASHRPRSMGGRVSDSWDDACKGQTTEAPSKAHRDDKFTCEIVTSNKEISDRATSEKVISNKLTSGKVTSNKVTSNKVTSNKVSRDSVTSEKVTSNKVSWDEVTREKSSDDKLTGSKVTSNKVSRDKVVTGKVTSDQLATRKANTTDGAASGEPAHATVTSVKRTHRRVASLSERSGARDAAGEKAWKQRRFSSGTDQRKTTAAETLAVRTKNENNPADRHLTKHHDGWSDDPRRKADDSIVDLFNAEDAGKVNTVRRLQKSTYVLQSPSTASPTDHLQQWKESTDQERLWRTVIERKVPGQAGRRPSVPGSALEAVTSSVAADVNECLCRCRARAGDTACEVRGKTESLRAYLEERLGARAAASGLALLRSPALAEAPGDLVLARLEGALGPDRTVYVPVLLCLHNLEQSGDWPSG